MTRPANKHGPDCAVDMHLAYNRSRRVMLSAIRPTKVADDRPPMKPTRHCDHHVTARFCFRTAGWLKQRKPKR